MLISIQCHKELRLAIFFFVLKNEIKEWRNKTQGYYGGVLLFSPFSPRNWKHWRRRIRWQKRNWNTRRSILQMIVIAHRTAHYAYNIKWMAFFGTCIRWFKFNGIEMKSARHLLEIAGDQRQKRTNWECVYRALLPCERETRINVITHMHTLTQREKRREI